MNTKPDYHKTEPKLSAFRLSIDDKDRLREVSARLGWSMSHIIKRALVLFYKALDSGEIKP